ncbi:hypothetical protein [Burkholderia glumae]|uniref:hypothetical protein n=1 Tax=Burkholderia glumae TaxID=337 RepID=UPI0020CDB7C4|nr:hypothetical protein [Burkholderia glumae]MCQ0034406.1 hypothetical protein [Burkholderia glumae]MCQ0039500.1 hypothetical protein [Burkholderia glumae]
MGIKMATALDVRGEEWLAEHYSKGKGVEPLRCAHCPTSVTHQGAYTCERHNKSVKVSAYFRLLKDGEHSDGCPHAIEGKIKKLVTPSEGLIEALREGKYRLRLIMVADALKATRQPTPNRNASGPRRDGGTVYRRTPDSLPAYINSAKKVLLLRAACDDDSNIEQYLELAFEGNTVVPWPSFYYETERYMEAYRAVSLQTVKHPVALHGVVKSKGSPVIGGRLTHVINLHSPRYAADADDAAHGISVEASIWSDDAAWFDGIEEDTEVVVLGIWNTKEGKRSPWKGPRKYRFSEFTTRKLNLTLSLKAQISKVPNNRCAEGKGSR